MKITHLESYRPTEQEMAKLMPHWTAEQVTRYVDACWKLANAIDEYVEARKAGGLNE